MLFNKKTFREYRNLIKSEYCGDAKQTFNNNDNYVDDMLETDFVFTYNRYAMINMMKMVRALPFDDKGEDCNG